MSNDTFQYTAGVFSVGQYQISGKPYATASLVISASSSYQVKFPTVTKFFTVSNNATGISAPLRVGFSANGVGGSNYFIVNNGESYTAEIRTRYLYLMGDTIDTTASIIAGLTGISSELTDTFGNNYSGSIGIG